LSLQGLYRWYDNHYADWSPDSREVEGDADRAQVWKSPSYGKLDLHLSYKLPEIAGLDMTLSGHIFNALDNVYVQDAVDNSKYNGYGDKVHAAHNAEVFQLRTICQFLKGKFGGKISPHFFQKKLDFNCYSS
jgi:hypothetical protein